MKAACSYPTEPGARMYKAAIDKINADNHTKSTPHAALARKGVGDSDDSLHRSSCSAGSLAAAATAHPRSSAPWSDAPPLAPRSESTGCTFATSTLRAPILGGHAARATRRPSARRPPARPRRANGRRLGQPACRAEASDATAQQQTYAVPGRCWPEAEHIRGPQAGRARGAHRGCGAVVRTRMLEPVWWGARSGAHLGLEVDLQIRALSGCRRRSERAMRHVARG